MSLGADTPEAPNPAKRPERGNTVQPEDVVVADSEQSTEEEERSRRALRRPAGNAVGQGSNVGTGLST